MKARKLNSLDQGCSAVVLRSSVWLADANRNTLTNNDEKWWLEDHIVHNMRWVSRQLPISSKRFLLPQIGLDIPATANKSLWKARSGSAMLTGKDLVHQVVLTSLEDNQLVGQAWTTGISAFKAKNYLVADDKSSWYIILRTNKEHLYICDHLRESWECLEIYENIWECL